MEGLLQDIHYAMRTLRKAPGFTSVVMLTLALAMGATTSIFSVVNGVILKPLPFPEPEQIHYIGWQWETGSTPGMLSPIKADHLRRHTDLLESIGIFTGLQAEIGKPSGSMIESQGLRVSAGWLQVLDQAPEHGRPFAPEEENYGAQRVLILGSERATQIFGTPGSAVGEAILVNDQVYEVIGVMPDDFRFPGAYGATDFLAPLQVAIDPLDGSHSWQLLARQVQSVTAQQLVSELDRLSTRFREQFPQAVANDQTGRFVPADYRTMLLGNTDQALWSLFAAVACVLLIAVVNIAVLMTTRAKSRRYEFALRGVLGAGRGRLTRQLLVECSLLGVMGSLLGLLLAWWMTGLILGYSPDLPRIEEVRLDGRVLSFAMLLGLATAVLFGLGAATAGLKLNLLDPLKVGSRCAGDHQASAQGRGALIALQAALAVILLSGAILSISTFTQLRSADIGFESEGLVLVEFGRVPQRYLGPASRWAFHRQLLERTRALPGVEAAAAWGLPFRTGLNIPVTSGSGPQQATGVVEWRAVSPHYFEVLGIPVLRGQAFSEHDREGSLPVAVVNEALDATFFSGQDPVGNHIQVGYMNSEPIFPGWDSQEGQREIIGVVGNIRESSPGEAARPTVYVPIPQVPEFLAVEFPEFFGLGAILATRAGPAGDTTSMLRTIIDETDPVLPPPRFHTVDDLLDNALQAEKLTAVLMIGFAAAALLLTALGLYGALAYNITQRYREIGLRMAVGATPGQLASRFMLQGLAWVCLGLIIGLLGALALSRFLPGSPVGLSDLPLEHLLAAVFQILAVCALAAYLPARRGAHVDPVVALRE